MCIYNIDITNMLMFHDVDILFVAFIWKFRFFLRRVCADDQHEHLP